MKETPKQAGERYPQKNIYFVVVEATRHKKKWQTKNRDKLKLNCSYFTFSLLFTTTRLIQIMAKVINYSTIEVEAKKDIRSIITQLGRMCVDHLAWVKSPREMIEFIEDCRKSQNATGSRFLLHFFLLFSVVFFNSQLDCISIAVQRARSESMNIGKIYNWISRFVESKMSNSEHVNFFFSLLRLFRDEGEEKKVDDSRVSNNKERVKELVSRFECWFLCLSQLRRKWIVSKVTMAMKMFPIHRRESHESYENVSAVRQVNGNRIFSLQPAFHMKFSLRKNSNNFSSSQIIFFSNSKTAAFRFDLNWTNRRNNFKFSTMLSCATGGKIHKSRAIGDFHGNLISFNWLENSNRNVNFSLIFIQSHQ